MDNALTIFKYNSMTSTNQMRFKYLGYLGSITKNRSTHQYVCARYSSTVEPLVLICSLDDDRAIDLHAGIEASALEVCEDGCLSFM